MSPGDRVKVIGPEYKGMLSSRFGSVLSVNRFDESAWVRMDGEVHRDLRWFPRGHAREHDIPLAAAECILVRAA